jgi:hypothetical protein
MNDWQRAAASWLVSNQGTWVVCALIGLFGVVVYTFYFWPRTRRITRSLRAARTALEQTADETSFALQFEELNAQFEGHPLLGHSWREFEDALVYPKPNDPRQVLRNSHEPSVYFHTAGVVEGQINLRFIQAVPGYLTGGGILGTFVGLVAGIYLASEGLASSDITKTRAALSPLLSGAAVAFLTSIVGLIGSLTFSMLEKRRLHRIDQEIGLWNDALDRRLQRVTPEQLAAEHIQEVAKQTLQLERFNTELAVSIAQALEARLSHTFTPKLNELVSGLDQLRGQQTSFSEDVLRSVTEQVATAMRSAAGTEMGQLKDTLVVLVRQLQEAVGGLAAGHEQMGGLVKGVVARMETAFGQSASALTTETTKAVGNLALYMESAGIAASTQLSNATASMSSTLTAAAGKVLTSLESAGEKAAGQLTGAASEASTRFSEAGVLVHAAATKFEQTAGRLSGLQEQNGAMLVELRSLLQNFREAHGAFRTSAEPLQGAVHSLNRVSESMRTQMKDAEAFHQALVQAAQDVRTSHQFMQQAWGQYETRFKGIDESLGRVFTQIDDGTRSYSGLVKTYIGEIDKSFSKALQDLGTIVRELDETVEAYARTSRPETRR